MWFIWLCVFFLVLGVIFALLRAGSHLADPRGHRRMVLVTGAVVLGVLIGPPVLRALREDFAGSVLRTGVAVVVLAGIGAYVWVLRRAHARARGKALLREKAPLREKD